MSRIRTIAHDICVNLENQVRVWRRLVELSQAQFAALKQQDAHSVHAILQQIEMTMLERSRTEVRRSQLVDEAANELGVPADAVTRDAIAARCDEPLAQSLATAAEQLRALVVELQAITRSNTALLQQELSIIEILVRGATEDRSVRTTYAKSGSRSEAPRLRLLDAQV